MALTHRFLVLAIALLATCAPAQLRITGTFKNVRYPDYYPETAPGQTNRPLKTLLQGEEARQIAPGAVGITGLNISYYRPDGAIEATVRASDCVFQISNRVAYGTGHLRAGSFSNLFTIEGDGFLWRQQDGLLIISNQVVTRIDRSLLGTNTSVSFSLTNLPATVGPTATGMVLTVTSDRCVFEGQSNRVVQSGHVVAEDNQVRLGCDELEVRLTPGRRLQDVAVRGQVSVLSKADGSRVEADQAVYQTAPDQENLLITGQPVWRDRDARQELRAERFRTDLKQRTLKAEDNAVLTVPRGAFNQPDLALAPGMMAGPATAAKPAADDTNQVQIAARQMTMLLPAPGRTGRTAVAEGDVVVTSAADQVRGTADRLEVREGEGTLAMDGRVTWTAAGRLVKTDHLTLDRTIRMAQGKGRALFRIPVDQAARTGFLRTASNRPAPANLVLEVDSDQFTYLSNSLVCLGTPVRARLLEGLVLRGQLTSPMLTVRFSNRLESVLAEKGVLAEHYPPNKPREVVTNLLSCETLAARFSESGEVIALVASENVQAAQVKISGEPPKTTLTELTCGVLTAVLLPKAGRVDKLQAERNVVVAQGDKLGRAQNVIYTDQAYRLVMTGQPYVEFSQGRIRDAEALIWDRATGKVTGTGRYRIEWAPPATDTNKVRLFLPKFMR